MDGLTKYIFDNYSCLLTIQESMAWRYFLFKAKGRTDAIQRIISNYSFKDIVDLISVSEEEFYVNVKNRILREHSEQIFLNYCPTCGHLTRTHKAEQCLQYKNSWH